MRVYWIADELAKLGFSVRAVVSDRRTKLMGSFFLIPFFDVIVFQKVFSRYHLWLLLIARILGKKTYIDIDDAPSRINSPVTIANVARMMGAATGVLAGSENLCEFSRRFSSRVHLVPSAIKLENYHYRHPEAAEAPITFGWIGNGAHYQDDLIGLLKEPLAVIASRIPVRFKLVGACGVKKLHEVFENIPGLEAVLVDSIDWGDPRAVREAVAEFDVGLYPLLDNEFNFYKCGFKLLEYAALGIPFVVSKVSANSSLMASGLNGFVVSNENEWISAMWKLANNPSSTLEDTARNYRIISNIFSTHAVANQLARIFNG